MRQSPLTQMRFLGCSWVFALGMPLLLGLSGCGGVSDAPERYQVVGTVRIGDQPVAAGVVQLIPNAQKGSSGPAGSAEIVNGQFDTAQRGTGIVGGSHFVVINGFDGKGDPNSEMPMGKPVFLGYRTEFDFPPVSEVPSGEPYKVEFEVPATVLAK